MKYRPYECAYCKERFSDASQRRAHEASCPDRPVGYLAGLGQPFDEPVWVYEWRDRYDD